MAIKSLITRLTSIGYSRGEIEYSLTEILQHKNPCVLNKTDIRILISMMEERIQFERAEQIRNISKCY
ncbi:MAG: hypothetical protein JL50_10700 [Peptococcaceae bacterium BICA1-7]|nr:MAG: hypothetical protein JL50_10700 [Peptococcaceae bacterium BICA1-7]HBV95752.1 hypothetical protein [Desulfotomaculum sp.]